MADIRTASSVVFSEARELRALAGIARGHA
jgi:hypothetical protein